MGAAAADVQMDTQRILVVDDDDAWLETIELILDGRYELYLTKEPDKAASLVASSFFALAILDRRISAEVSGVDLLMQLREIRPGLRGIILTGYAELEDAVESMKVGAFDYISKGRSDLTEELRRRVANALVGSPRVDDISALIAKGETHAVEFKASARWDMRTNKANRDLEILIVRTVAAFLNSEIGGVLLIGVDDTGNAIGLKSDYRTLKKQDRDGYENFLMTLLGGACGKDVSPLIEVDFHIVGGSEVCRVSVRPAPREVYVRDSVGAEHMFIRSGNSTRQLTPRETVEYCRRRWKIGPRYPQ